MVSHPPRVATRAPVTARALPRGLEPGDRAPSFALPDQRFATTRLSDFLGRKLLIVFFPLTFTPVCGGELTSLRDELPDFVGDDRALVAISTDTTAVHRAYDDREFLGYPLLSDFWPHGAVASAYGVFDERTGLALRGTFLVDEAGIVRWAVVHDIPDARSNDDYRSALASLSTGAAKP
jgi:peroxiredoxin